MTVVFSVIAAVVLYFVGAMSILLVETQRDDIAGFTSQGCHSQTGCRSLCVEGAVVGFWP
ncbi:MAG: hypothetical protein CM1200mP39_22410 [Dehalococcoidia bacterium]|nr:MAG: hypothetical protein CM1200mP39_22410 [Dehalococcoidia bacterium]